MSAVMKLRPVVGFFGCCFFGSFSYSFFMLLKGKVFCFFFKQVMVRRVEDECFRKLESRMVNLKCLLKGLFQIKSCY